MTAPSSEQLTLGDYVRVVRRRKWIVLAFVIASVAAGLFYSAHRGTAYSTKVDVAAAFLQPPTSSGTFTGGGSSGAAADARFLANQAAFARSAAVLGETARLAATGHAQIAMPKPRRPLVVKASRRVAITPQGLAAASSVTPSSTADILEFGVTRRNAGDSSALANAYAEAYVGMRKAQIAAQFQPIINRLNSEIAKFNRELSDPATSNAAIRSIRPQLAIDSKNVQPLQNYVTQATDGVQVQPTTSSTAVVKLSPVKYGLGAGAVGLVLGLIIAFIWDAIDNGPRTRREFAGMLSLPVLANLPTPARRLRTGRRLVSLEPGEAAAESFRLLAVRLDVLATRSKMRSILVTSALDDEGKSTTAANLCVAFAQLGKSVILVDSDLIRPTAARFFAAEKEIGLYDVLSTATPVEDVLVDAHLPASELGAGQLRIVPPGHTEGDATGLLASGRLGDVMKSLEAGADYVVVDSPPVLSVSHATLWSARVDAVLVVARADRITPEVTRDLQTTLDGLPAPSVGVVLTGVDGGPAYPYYGRSYQPLAVPANATANGNGNGNGASAGHAPAKPRPAPRKRRVAAASPPAGEPAD